MLYQTGRQQHIQRFIIIAVEDKDQMNGHCMCASGVRNIQAELVSVDCRGTRKQFKRPPVCPVSTVTVLYPVRGRQLKPTVINYVCITLTC